MRRVYKRNVVIGIGLLVGGVASGQVGVIFSVTDSKPLAQAAEKFEVRYGIPVSYEDPTYAYDGDLVDHTDPAYKQSHPNGPRALSPKVGTVAFQADPHMAVSSAAAAMPLIQSLLDDHVKAGNLGQFKLIPNPYEDGIAIVPVAIRNAAGVLSPDQSPLETKISFPQLQRTAMQTLDAICGAIQANTGKQIGVASAPFGGQPYSATIGANNETARNVLQRTLANIRYPDGQTGQLPKTSWNLLYDPGVKMYLLNVRQVLREVPTPTGRTIRRPVVR